MVSAGSEEGGLQQVAATGVHLPRRLRRRYLLRRRVPPRRHHVVPRLQEPRRRIRGTVRCERRLWRALEGFWCSCVHDWYPDWSPMVHLRYNKGRVRAEVRRLTGYDMG